MSLTTPQRPCEVCGKLFAPRLTWHRHCQVCFYGSRAVVGVAVALKNQQLARQAHNAGR